MPAFLIFEASGPGTDDAAYAAAGEGGTFSHGPFHVKQHQETVEVLDYRVHRVALSSRSCIQLKKSTICFSSVSLATLHETKCIDVTL